MSEDTDERFVRQEKLIETIKASASKDVVGLVGSVGVSGSRFPGEVLTTLSFDFVAWRVAGSEIVKGPLRVSKAVTEGEFDELERQIQPDCIIRIRAKIGESAFGGHLALLDEIVGFGTADTELSNLAEELQQPGTLEHTTFGTLLLDRKFNSYGGSSVWNGNDVAISIEDASQTNESLKTAEELWNNQKEWDQRIRAFAIEDLMPLKNESWLDEGEKEVSFEQFDECMKLKSISVFPDGDFHFAYSDGGLFSGHSIVVSGSLVDGPTRADI